MDLQQAECLYFLRDDFDLLFCLLAVLLVLAASHKLTGLTSMEGLRFPDFDFDWLLIFGYFIDVGVLDDALRWFGSESFLTFDFFEAFEGRVDLSVLTLQVL